MGNLNIPQIADNQANPEATVNQATNRLDIALTENLAVDLTSGDVTLTNAQFQQNIRFKGTGHSVERNLTVPAIKRLFIVANAGSDILNVLCGSGSVVIASGTGALIYTDGTANGIESVSEGGATVVQETGTNFRAPHFGAAVGLTADFAGNTAAATDIPWTTAAYDTGYDPADGGLSQRFWLGANFTFATTDVNTSTNVITETGHGMVTGEGPTFFTSSGGLPSGIAAGTKYWIIRVDNDNFKLATSRANAIAGTAVTLSTQGTGTHTCRRGQYLVVPAGITKVRLSGGAGADSDLAGFFSISPTKNGSATNWIIAPGFIIDTATSLRDAFTSPVLEVVEGDYFTLTEQGADAYTLSGDQGRTYFAIEVVETADQADPPYDIVYYSPGTPTVSVALLRYVAGRPFLLPASLPLSEAFAGTAPSGGSVAFDVQKNGGSIGTISFADAAQTATFTFASDQGFANGDVLSIIAPGNLRSMANISFNLAGIRQ